MNHCLMRLKKDLSGKIERLETMKQTIFYEDAFPGDQVRVEVNIVKKKDNSRSFEVKAFVDGVLICESEVVFRLSEISQKSAIHPTASIHPSAVIGKGMRNPGIVKLKH